MAKVSLAEAAGMLGVSIETVRRRIKRGDIRGEKVKTDHGYQWFVEAEDLAPKDTPTMAVDVVELRRAIAPEDLIALIEAAQAPLLNQIEQQGQIIAELSEQVAALSDKLEQQRQQDDEPAEKVGFWKRLFG